MASRFINDAKSNRNLTEGVETTLQLALGWMVLLVAFGFIITFINFFLVLLKMYSLQSLLTWGSWDALQSMGTAWIALCISSAILGLLQSLGSRYLGRQVAEHMTVPAIIAVAQYANNGNQSLRTVLNDIEIVRDTVSNFAGKMLVSIVMTPLLVPLTFTIHWSLGVVIGCFCLVISLLNLSLVRVLARSQDLAADNAAKSYGAVVGAMQSGEVVLAMGMLPRLCRHWLAVSSENAQAAWRADEDAARLRFLNDLTLGIFRGALMFTLSGLQFVGASSHGLFAGAAILVAQVASPFTVFGQTSDRWAEANSAWRRLRRLANNAGRAGSDGLAFPCSSSRLVAEHLSFTFGGGQPYLLRNIQLAVEPGQVVAILGGSGSGKSTLLRLMLGLHRPSVGGIYLDGHATSQWDRRDLARHVGYLPQEPLLPRGRLAEVIARLEQPDMELVLDAARLAGAHHITAGLPLGYATPVAGSYQFSMGQRHRIALARALYGRPKLLLLDELASSLDAEGEADMAALLVELRQAGHSIVFTTRRQTLLKAADRVLALRNGTLVPAGVEAYRSPLHAESEGRLLA